MGKGSISAMKGKKTRQITYQRVGLLNTHGYLVHIAVKQILIT